MLVLLFCLGTALAIAVSRQDDGASDVVAAVEKDDIRNQQPSMEQGEASRDNIRYDLSAIKRTMPENVQTSGLFGSKAWNPPPALIPVSTLPPPPPNAPPLAFTFIGRMIDRGEVTIFLSKGGRQYTVKVNNTLDNTYRVDKINATEAVLTYLPLNTQQTLVFNSTTIGSSALNDAMTTLSAPLAQQIIPVH